MHGLRIYFDLGVWKRLLELNFRVWLGHVVIRRDTKIHVSLDLGRKQMRTVGFVGDQSAAVERRSGAYAVGHGRTSPNDQRAAHAITLSADLFRFVDLFLRIQEGDVSD